jgi:hypothetical protein
VTQFITADVERDDGSRGSHPHSDRPNWRPAETYDEYVSNCQEGLEEWSERRAAKLLACPELSCTAGG